MDGALMRFSFFFYPFLDLISFFFGGNFIFSLPPPQSSFGFFLQNFPPLPSPTYSHLLLTHPSIYLPTCPFTFLFTKPLGRYLPNPTYKASSTYLVTIPIDPAIAKNNEGKKNEGIALSLDLFIEANLRA